MADANRSIARNSGAPPTTADRALVPSKPAADHSIGPLETVAPGPLFLHSSFRTGSTWLWEKIRSAPTTFAYYEIFNEMLADLTHARVRATSFDAWASRHPAMPPYFLTFLPLISPDGGVTGYDRAMAFDGFVPRDGLDGQLSASERAYVDSLVAAARAGGALPVLSCTRSLGRARALRRAIGGTAVAIRRNLFHQWASYCSLAEAGNPYFLGTVRATVEASRHDPYLRGLGTYFDLRDPGLPRADLFQSFVLLHLYIEGFAFDVADLVVDTTEIATDAGARRSVERQLSAMIRHPLDLSDVRHVCELPDMGFAWSATVRDAIEQFAKLIPRTGRSAESVGFVERIKDQALAEWERFDFFDRGTRSVLTGRIDDLETRLTAQIARGDELRAEKERLDAALSDAARAADVQKGALARRIVSAEAELDGLRARVDSLSSERDVLAAKAAAASTRIGSLEQALAEGTGLRGLWRRLSRKAPRRSA